MNLPNFADVVQIKLQDAQSLSLIGADYHAVQFEINGIEELHVLLTDYREQSLLTMHEQMAGGNPNWFLRSFNTPAFALIGQSGERTWTIDLYETSEISPINTLEVGTEYADRLPIHQYDFYHYEPTRQGPYNFLAIYQNDPVLVPKFTMVPAFAEV